MKVLVQLILFCFTLTGVVAFLVRDGAINGLYFYPKPVQERAFELGLIDRKTLKKKKKQSGILLYIVLLLALLLIVGLWNGVDDFKTAFFQALLFVEVMNWYDGIVIDKVWVGHSKFWVIPGTEDLPFVPTWKQVLKKRGVLTLLWPVGAVIVALLVVLLF